MEPKKLAIQVVAAIILYVGISLILEKDFNRDILYREMIEGLVFGVVYGLFIWLRAKWMKKK
ncbi:MAG: hypothetical protein ACR2MM_05195 [Flavobacteriaceae bacterium]